MFGQDRRQLRRIYLDAWQRHQDNKPLQALDQQIVAVIAMHPEYHSLLENDAALDRDFHPGSGEANPFMHMGMHIAIRDQTATDRPAGVLSAYRQLLTKYQDTHTAEHHLMECLGRVLWEAQRSGDAPDEAGYLHCVNQLCQG